MADRTERDLSDPSWMRDALRLARRGYGRTSPNPMVGAVLVKSERIIGQGWHRRAGGAHAEIEALRDAQARGHSARGATMYVTLEPCSTFGRTPPCTEAIIAAGIRRVVVAAADPNPKHDGEGLQLLERAGIQVARGVLEAESLRLNEAFNHWIVHGTPFVTLKSAMSLDGRIATVSGESKWITGERARALAMRLRRGADAILAGINTILADDPALTCRSGRPPGRVDWSKKLRRIVIDSLARTPLDSKVLAGAFDESTPTLVVVSESAPKRRVAALAERAQVWTAPMHQGKIDLRALLRKLGSENVTHLLVEGGGEIHASFLSRSLAHRVAFFYAPKVLGGVSAPRAVGGAGAASKEDVWQLESPEWRQVGSDLFLTARIRRPDRETLRSLG